MSALLASLSERKDAFNNNELFTLHAKSNRIANIANGTGHKYSRSVKEIDMAKQVFVTDEEGTLVFKEQPRDWEHVDILDMHYDHCPLVIQEYKDLRLVSTENGDEVFV